MSRVASWAAAARPTGPAPIMATGSDWVDIWSSWGEPEDGDHQVPNAAEFCYIENIRWDGVCQWVVRGGLGNRSRCRRDMPGGQAGLQRVDQPEHQWIERDRNQGRRQDEVVSFGWQKFQ